MPPSVASAVTGELRCAWEELRSLVPMGEVLAAGLPSPDRLCVVAVGSDPAWLTYADASEGGFATAEFRGDIMVVVDELITYVVGGLARDTADVDVRFANGRRLSLAASRRAFVAWAWAADVDEAVIERVSRAGERSATIVRA
jgi:hypothetical protein